MNDTGPFYAEIGRRLRLAREAAGLTQDLLAGRVGLSRTSVTHIERGRQKVLAHTLWDLSVAVGVVASELYPDEGWKAPTRESRPVATQTTTRKGHSAPRVGERARVRKPR